MARLSEIGKVQLLVEKETKQILGAQIVGEEASHMIHMFIQAMTFQIDAISLLNMIFIHPALPEIGRNALRKIRDQVT